MTVEEKAKAYDEALERAKSLIGDTIIEESGQHIAETIFPELAESKDEKMRKTLIKNFTMLGSDWDRWGGLKREDILAWLERQKPTKWDREDEEELTELLKVLHANSYYSFDDWLQSLRDKTKDQ